MGDHKKSWGWSAGWSKPTKKEQKARHVAELNKLRKRAR